MYVVHRIHIVVTGYYSKPNYVGHFYPQRYVTLVLSLSDVEEGGETVFPFSNATYGGVGSSSEIKDQPMMDECSKGLAIPPKKGRGILFYSQTPQGDEDLLSRHGSTHLICRWH